MSKPLFWLDWPLSYRWLYTFVLVIFLGTLAYTGYCFWRGDAAAIQWEVQPDLDVATIAIDTFSKHFFEFNVTADTYLLIEKFKASDIQFNLEAYQIHLGLYIFGLLIILCAISDLSLTHYGVGLAIVAVFVSGMNLEEMRIGHSINEHFLTIITLGLYGTASYIFRSYFPSASYLMRLLVYWLITGGLAYMIASEGAVKWPAMHFASHGYAMPMIMSLFFMLFNGHEIVRGILAIASLGAPGSRMRQFWFLSFLYLANLIYVFAKTNLHYSLDIYYVPAVPIFIVTALVGVWGLRYRAEQIQEVAAFAPTASFLYLGSGIIVFSYLAISFATANDSQRQVLEDGILYSHITLAAVFMAYIYFNFKDLVAQGHQAMKVLYKPLVLPFLYAWLFATTIAIGLQFENGFALYNKALSGYYVGIADLEWMNGEQYVAKQLYSIGQTYDLMSHRIHYSLGSMARQEQQKDAAALFFEEGQARNPSPHAYANISALKEGSDFSFDPFFQLDQGLSRFPNSVELLNNKGLLFNKTRLLDSAYVYLANAREKGGQRMYVEANLYTLLTKYNFPNADSLIADWELAPYIGTASNELAFMTKMGKVSDKPLNRSFLPDSALDTKQLCYLYNYVLNHAQQPDTALLSHLEHLSRQVANEQFDMYLYFIIGHGYYKSGQLRKAFQYLKAAKDDGGALNSHFPNMYGLRLLEHEKYSMAAKYFEQAWMRGNEDALLNLAIATSEFDQQQALQLWEKVRATGKEGWVEAANDMLLLLAGKPAEMPLENADPQYDLLRYRYLHYQRDLPHARFMQLANMIATPVLHASILSERSQLLTDKGEYLPASECMAAITSKVLDEQTEPYLEMAYLKWKHAQGQFDAEFQARADVAGYPSIYKGKRACYLAAYQASKGQLKEAEKLYRQAMEELPFDDQPFLELSQVLQAQKRESDAYQILLSGLYSYPESARLQQEYAMLCLTLRYDSYAEDAKLAVRELLSAEAYKVFEAKFEAKKAEIAKSVEVWQ